eukprot:6312871-Lingulodinium_polyedra.AAC.1
MAPSCMAHSALSGCIAHSLEHCRWRIADGTRHDAWFGRKHDMVNGMEHGMDNGKAHGKAN